MKELYSHEDIRKTYEIIREHKLTRSIIQRYAVNSLDFPASERASDRDFPYFSAARGNHCVNGSLSAIRHRE